MGGYDYDYHVLYDIRYHCTTVLAAGVAGESDSWDFGVGAGFYLDATNGPWSTNYRMYSYITKELPEVIRGNFPSINLNK